MEMDAKENLEHIASFDMESKETWAQDWETDNPEFHTDEVNAMLTKHHDEVTRGRKNLRVLVPLCGKSLDMIWLADQGHSVVGVELIRKGIELFFRDNKLTYNEKSVSLSPENQGTVFKNNGKNITLYECSIFDFSAKIAGGKFDFIWDRGSMTAINMMREGRLKQYTDIMLSCLKPGGRYFLEFFAPESPENTPTQFKFLSEKSITENFGERCTIRYFGKQDMPAWSGSVDEGAVEQEPGPNNQDMKIVMHYYLMDFK